jgi:hypothetical protein
MALPRRICLEPAFVAARADEFPLIRGLLGDRVESVLSGTSKRADAAPLLLRLLEQTGENSQAMLERVEAGLRYFDALCPEGWDVWRGSLAGADRTTLLSRYSELLVAQEFDDTGYEIIAFEPTGAPGQRADLLVRIAGDELLVEVTMPGPHTHDWVDEAMDHLTLALSRVESGLAIRVEGYEAFDFDPTGEWGAKNRAVASQERDGLVNAFFRAAEQIDLSGLPAVIVEPSEGQPVRITAEAHDPAHAAETVISSSWSRSGLVPNVARLTEKILDERQHLPDERPSAILVDLGRWNDFRNADYYLRQVAIGLAKRDVNAVFVGTFVGVTKGGLIERSVLAADDGWRSTCGGRRLLADWAGTILVP